MFTTCAVGVASAQNGTPVGPGTPQYLANQNFTCKTNPEGTTLVRKEVDEISGINANGIVTRSYRIEKIQMEPQVVLSGHGFFVSQGPVADTGCGGSLDWSLTIKDTDGTGKSPAVFHLDQTSWCPGLTSQKHSDDFQLSCALNELKLEEHRGNKALFGVVHQ